MMKVSTSRLLQLTEAGNALKLLSSRWHVVPKRHWLWKHLGGIPTAWILFLSTFANAGVTFLSGGDSGPPDRLF